MIIITIISIIIMIIIILITIIMMIRSASLISLHFDHYRQEPTVYINGEPVCARYV